MDTGSGDKDGGKCPRSVALSIYTSYSPQAWCTLPSVIDAPAEITVIHTVRGSRHKESRQNVASLERVQ